MVPLGMIDTWNAWLKFVTESLTDDLLLHVVPVHHGIHSAINSPSVLFIRNLDKKKTYYYAFDHPDVKTLKPVDHKQIIENLSHMSGKKWVINKKAFIQMIPLAKTYDVGFADYLRLNKVFEVDEFDSSAHTLIQRNFANRPGYGKFVPVMKHLQSFSELAESCENIIKKTRFDEAFTQFNEFIIEPLAEIETHGLAVDSRIVHDHFGDISVTSGKVYTEYNVFTATGRPSNRFGGVNFAALNKEDGSRRSFVSRFGSNGKLILIDYSAFHPRIISHLTNYSIASDVDIYEYLAGLYFNKSDVDDGDIADAKQITFRQLYGGVEEKYIHIKYLSHLKDFINYNWKFFNEHGYVETPIFKRKITDKHIITPKPATVFNYLLQAAEGEISIPILGNVNVFLRNKRTKAVLYTYDSILFDYHLDDGDVMWKVRDMMSLDNTFPMKWYAGDNYQEMELLEA